MKKRIRFSIRMKTIAMIVTFAIFLASISLTTFAIHSNRTIEKQYKSHANDLSGSVAELVDEDLFLSVKNDVKAIYDTIPNKVTSEEWGTSEWEEYTAKFDSIYENENFIDLRSMLRNVQKRGTGGFDCVYLIYIDPANEAFVYVCDSSEEDPCPPGCIDPVYDINKPIFDDPTRGFPAYITNTKEYGWLVTAGAPVYKGEEIIGYAMVDLSMSVIRKAQNESFLRLLLYVAITVVALCAIGIIVVNHTLVKPVNKLTGAAKSYDGEHINANRELFTNLNIKTNDELEDLWQAMTKMDLDINKQIKELTKLNEELTASQKAVNEITVLANKDALTGVRNKIAYDKETSVLDEQIAAKEKVQFGVVMVDLNDLKLTNDQYGHKYGDAALIKLSNIFCTVFSHSPVFRIGGDEFVAIVRNTDYRKADDLIKEFNERIEGIRDDEELPPEERISAAIGFAAYDSKIDNYFVDVFARADKKMYERKKQMKKKS